MDLLHAVAAGELPGRPAGWRSRRPRRPGCSRRKRKGVIAAGSDADIVIYDPQARQTLFAVTYHMNVDYSAYEGLQITGRVVTTSSRGHVVVDDGAYQGNPGYGPRPRGLNQYLLSLRATSFGTVFSWEE